MSARIFRAVMTLKSWQCQALAEGNYSGIFRTVLNAVRSGLSRKVVHDGVSRGVIPCIIVPETAPQSVTSILLGFGTPYTRQMFSKAELFGRAQRGFTDPTRRKARGTVIAFRELAALLMSIGIGAQPSDRDHLGEGAARLFS